MAETGKTSAAARAKAANEDLAKQIEVLKAEVSKLAGQLDQSKRRSAGAAKKAAADSVESLRAQGEIAMDSLRESADEIEAEIVRHVRKKPVTSLALAAAVGFMLALIARR